MQYELSFILELGNVMQDRNEVALEVLDFIKSHHGLLDRILRDDNPNVHIADLDELQLATAILSKVMILLPGFLKMLECTRHTGNELVVKE